MIAIWVTVLKYYNHFNTPCKTKSVGGESTVCIYHMILMFQIYLPLTATLFPFYITETVNNVSVE